MRARPRTKLVIKRNTARCAKCGALVRRHTRCKRCSAKQPKV